MEGLERALNCTPTIFSNGRNFQKQILGEFGLVRIGLATMPMRNEQLGVVKGCAFPAHPFVGQGFEEGHQVGFFAWADGLLEYDGRKMVGIGQVAAAKIKVDNLLLSEQATIVHIRSGQLDISQRGDFKRPVHSH